MWPPLCDRGGITMTTALPPFYPSEKHMVLSVKLQFQLSLCHFSFFLLLLQLTNQWGQTATEKSMNVSPRNHPGNLHRHEEKPGNMSFNCSTQRISCVNTSSREGEGFFELACHHAGGAKKKKDLFKKIVLNSYLVGGLLLVSALYAYVLVPFFFYNQKLLSKIYIFG